MGQSYFTTTTIFHFLMSYLFFASSSFTSFLSLQLVSVVARAPFLRSDLPQVHQDCFHISWSIDRSSLEMATLQSTFAIAINHHVRHLLLRSHSGDPYVNTNNILGFPMKGLDPTAKKFVLCHKYLAPSLNLNPEAPAFPLNAKVSVRNLNPEAPAINLNPEALTSNLNPEAEFRPEQRKFLNH